MRSLVLLGLLAGFAAAAEEPPAKKELFAKEEWYKGQRGKEQDFVGVLEKAAGGGGIGFGRFNPYRLVMTVTVPVIVEEKIDGKIVRRTEFKTEKRTREVYVGGKPDLLAPYVGKKVKLTGKAVDMEVEGKQHHEIWPARLEVVPDKKPAKPKP
jgi:hypothetical protein